MESIYILLWHEYKYCTKCLSEVFRMAQFCTYFLKKNFGGGPPDPLSLLLSKDVLLRNEDIFILLKWALQVFGTNLSVKKAKKKKKKLGPPFLKSWIRHCYSIDLHVNVGQKAKWFSDDLFVLHSDSFPMNRSSTSSEGAVLAWSNNRSSKELHWNAERHIINPTAILEEGVAWNHSDSSFTCSVSFQNPPEISSLIHQIQRKTITTGSWNLFT